MTLRIVLLALVLCAGIWDVRVRRIPNWLTVSGAILGIILNIVLVPHGFREASLGMLCALAVYTPLWLIRGMGAGDVKLMGAVGAIAGPTNWLVIFLSTALFAGACSLLVVIARRRFASTMQNVGTILSSLFHRVSPAARDARISIDNPQALRMPHGAFIASGAMLFLLLSGAA